MYEILNDYRMFYEQKWVATVDVELPEFTWKTETTSGSGFLGDIETIAVGHLEAMEVTINFNTVNAVIYKLLEPKTHELVFRSSLQGRDGATSKLTKGSHKVTVLAEPKSSKPGKLGSAQKMDSGVTMAVNYIEVTLDGKVVTKIDKINYICIINGVDYVEEIRKNIGL